MTKKDTKEDTKKESKTKRKQSKTRTKPKTPSDINLLDNRVIRLTKAVDRETSEKIVEQLLKLDAIKCNKDIIFYINSPGGSVSDGMAIYDAMQIVKSDVKTICLGRCSSMAAILLSGGTKGKRYITPNSEVMIHQPLGGAQGQASDIAIQAEHILKIKKRMNAILAENTGKSVKQIEKDVDRDNYMSAQEALAYGLVDKIFDKRA